MDKIRNVIIIGSGPAGYTAGLYTSRALLKPLMFSGYAYGGQLMLTTDVENYPGYPKGITGPEMMIELREQAERFGCEIIDKNVDSVDFSSRPFKVTVGGEEFQSEAIIICTGAEAIWLDADNEEEQKGRGISTCATCDGAFFKDEEVLVIGGGDSAMEEATFLTRFASKVTLLHRRDVFRASTIMHERGLANPKIEVKTFRQIKKWISNDDGLTGAIIEDPRDNSTEEIQAGGAFIAIGHKPMTDFSELFKHIQLSSSDNEVIIISDGAKNYGYDNFVAKSALEFMENKNYIKSVNNKIFPIKMRKPLEVAHILIDYPNGLHWKKIYENCTDTYSWPYDEVTLKNFKLTDTFDSLVPEVF